MIVVSNTSPLHYLIAVERAEILQELFGEIRIPPAVSRELTHSSAPLVIRRWMTRPPDWLQVHSLESPLNVKLEASLDEGEAEAIQLALEQKAEFLILDEQKGRATAKGQGLPVIGALGVLGLAYQQRILDEPSMVLDMMRKEGFRISDRPAGRFQQLLKNALRSLTCPIQ